MILLNGERLCTFLLVLSSLADVQLLQRLSQRRRHLLGKFGHGLVWTVHVQRNKHTNAQAWADWHTRVTQWIIYSSRNLTVTPVTSPPWLRCTDKANRDKHTTWQTPAITRASEKDGCWYKWELTADLKHTPGSLLLQHLCRFGALIDYLTAFGVFNLALIRRHLGPQRLLGFHVAVAPAGTALRSKPHGSLQSCSGNEALDEIPDPTCLIKYFLQNSL